MKFRYIVPDYEHEGDLKYGIGEILKVCPKAKNLISRQERDFEREQEYFDEYGDREQIFQGIIDFEADGRSKKKLMRIGCYII